MDFFAVVAGDCNVELVPHSNHAVVSVPFGFTEPLSVAAETVMDDAPAVVAVGRQHSCLLHPHHHNQRAIRRREGKRIVSGEPPLAGGSGRDAMHQIYRKVFMKANVIRRCEELLSRGRGVHPPPPSMGNRKIRAYRGRTLFVLIQQSSNMSLDPPASIN